MRRLLGEVVVSDIKPFFASSSVAVIHTTVQVLVGHMEGVGCVVARLVARGLGREQLL